MIERPLPPWLARLIRATDRVAHGLGLASGAGLTLLALFITVDVLGRRFGGPYTGATDEISVFMLALAATWGLAYTTSVGKHIRIDLTLHWLSRRMRRVVDYTTMALLAVFAAILAYNSWGLALESATLGSVSMSKLSIPLVYPQAAMATGFTLLALHACVLLLAAPFVDLESLSDAHRGEADRIQEL